MQNYDYILYCYIIAYMASLKNGWNSDIKALQ